MSVLLIFILTRAYQSQTTIDSGDLVYSTNNITGFPTETKKLAFDTIELNRHIDATNTSIYSFVPFHGTPLRKLCEELGYIKPETITKW